MKRRTVKDTAILRRKPGLHRRMNKYPSEKQNGLGREIGMKNSDAGLNEHRDAASGGRRNMNWLKKRKETKVKNRRYYGYRLDELDYLVDTLTWLEYDACLTDNEKKALHVATSALCDIQEAMATDGKVVIDG